MSYKVIDICMKNRTQHFFDDIINIKDFDPTILKQMKSHTKIFLFTTLHM